MQPGSGGQCQGGIAAGRGSARQPSPYDAAKLIEAFSYRLRDEVHLDSLTAELLALVDQTVEPRQVSLWLRVPATQPRESASSQRSCRVRQGVPCRAV